MKHDVALVLFRSILESDRVDGNLVRHYGLGVASDLEG